MAKRVQISIDGGTTYFTLPGNTGDLKSDMGAIDDTIFGYDYGSEQPGLINWTLSANGLYKGFAGYQATIKKTGTTTAFTAEAATLVTGKTYQITDVTKRIWDRTVPVVVKDNAVTVSAANILSIDYLYGIVVFVSGYTVTGPVTLGGSYLATAIIGCTNSYTLTQKANAIDITCMSDAQGNGGNRVFSYGLKTVQLELKGIKRTSDDFVALITGRAEVIVEINPDGAAKSVARGYFKPMSTDQSGKVGDTEDMTLTFDLSVPDNSVIPYPFQWAHAASTTLNTALKNLITAWQTALTVNLRYLEDGTTGKTGQGIVTDITLTGGLEAMNEFAATFQGTGAQVSYP